MSNIKRLKDFPEGSGSLTADDVFIFMDNPSGVGVTKKISLSNSRLVRSNTTGITGASGVNNLVYMSQASYDAIGSGNYDPSTIYFIV
jgi:hypothetical protein